MIHVVESLLFSSSLAFLSRFLFILSNVRIGSGALALAVLLVKGVQVLSLKDAAVSLAPLSGEEEYQLDEEESSPGFFDRDDANSFETVDLDGEPIQVEGRFEQNEDGVEFVIDHAAM
jgi:hypothetical protein